MKLVVVDFDDTLIRRDSFFYFILFDRGYFRLIGIISLFLPLLLLVKFFPNAGGFIKSAILRFTFKGRSYDNLSERGKLFIDYLKKKNFFNLELVNYLYSLQKEDYEICIVSASPDFIIKSVAEAFRFEYISTRFLFLNGKFTGKYQGKNCKGIEKVNQIKMKYDLSKLNHFIAIGNKDDKEMLELADQFILI